MLLYSRRRAGFWGLCRGFLICLGLGVFLLLFVCGGFFVVRFLLSFFLAAWLVVFLF